MNDPRSTRLVLSIFPGIGLLDRGFESAGFCVVRGPDPLFGGDIRNFHPPASHFSGVIGGPPCPDFSKARRTAPTGYGLAMLREFARVVTAAAPEWFLMENVPSVPTLAIHGYDVQRLDYDAAETGSDQHRLRHFQFGSAGAVTLVRPRIPKHSIRKTLAPTCTASESRRAGRRSFADFCELQGLPRDFDLPGFTVAAKYHAVGNGVHVAVATELARSITAARPSWFNADLCQCGCGRQIQGREHSASPACRKRLERSRRGQSQPTLQV